MHMLLPGDCAFDRIPSLPANLSLRVIVAYHHGASTDWCVATEQRLAHAGTLHDMAYSYGTYARGQPNHYGHPNRSNYQACTPDWDAVAITTEDVRARKRDWADLNW